MNEFTFVSIVIMLASRLFFESEVVYEKHDSWPEYGWGESQDLSEDFYKYAFEASIVNDMCCLRFPQETDRETESYV